MLRRSAAAVLAALCCATSAQAQLIERDWLAPGDGLLTFDPSTGLEWLDLSESLLGQFVDGEPTFPPDRPNFVQDGVEAFENVKNELLPGGRFEGFRVASAEEFLQLVDDSGFDVSGIDTPENRLALAALIDLIGVTRSRSPRFQFSFGVLDEECDPTQNDLCDFLPLVQGQLLLAISLDGTDAILEAPVSNAFETNSLADTGVWLVRRAIPEPPAASILACGVTLLSRRGFR